MRKFLLEFTLDFEGEELMTNWEIEKALNGCLKSSPSSNPEDEVKDKSRIKIVKEIENERRKRKPEKSIEVLENPIN